MLQFIEQLVNLSDSQEPKVLEKSAIALLLTEEPLAKSFLEMLIKAGSGEGSRGGHVIGHTKSGEPIYDSEGRKPYPGEEAHNLDMTEAQRKKTYVPAGGLQPHYSDSEPMRAYKNLVTAFKRLGVDFQGHITFDPKTEQITTLTPKGEAAVKQILTDIKSKQNPTDKK